MWEFVWVSLVDLLSLKTSTLVLSVVECPSWPKGAPAPSLDVLIDVAVTKLGWPRMCGFCRWSKELMRSW